MTPPPKSINSNYKGSMTPRGRGRGRRMKSPREKCKSPTIEIRPMAFWKTMTDDDFGDNVQITEWPLDELTVAKGPNLRKGYHSRCLHKACVRRPEVEFQRLEDRLVALSPRMGAGRPRFDYDQTFNADYARGLAEKEPAPVRMPRPEEQLEEGLFVPLKPPKPRPPDPCGPPLPHWRYTSRQAKDAKEVAKVNNVAVTSTWLSQVRAHAASM